MTKKLLLLHNSLKTGDFSTSECCFWFDIFSREAYDKILNSFRSGIRLNKFSNQNSWWDLQYWRTLPESNFFFVFWREKTCKISKFWCGERFMQRFENRNSFRSGINLKKVFDVKIMIFHAILKEFTWMQILSFLSFEKVLWKSLSKIHVKVPKHEIIAYEAFK